MVAVHVISFFKRNPAICTDAPPTC